PPAWGPPPPRTRPRAARGHGPPPRRSPPIPLDEVAALDGGGGGHAGECKRSASVISGDPRPGRPAASPPRRSARGPARRPQPPPVRTPAALPGWPRGATAPPA